MNKLHIAGFMAAGAMCLSLLTYRQPSAIELGTDHTLGVVIASDQKLYEVCALDFEKANFESTPCGMYLQGFITSYVQTATKYMGLLPSKEQEAALKDFGACDITKVPLKKITEEFLKDAEEINDGIQKGPTDPGLFLFRYITECNSIAITQADGNTQYKLPNEKIESFYSFDHNCCDNKVRYVQKTLNLLEAQSVKHQVGIIEVDLNGDRKVDFLAQIHSPVHCGSSGCALHIFLNQGDENYVEVQGPSVTYWDVGVSKQEKNHLRDLIFKSKDGSDCVWAWDGTEYKLGNCAKKR